MIAMRQIAQRFALGNEHSAARNPRQCPAEKQKLSDVPESSNIRCQSQRFGQPSA